MWRPPWLPREQDRGWDVRVALADRYPDFSICGLPFYLSGEAPDWRDLAHRGAEDLAPAGIQLALETMAIDADVAAREVTVAHGGAIETVAYDELLVATGANPVHPPIPGVDLDGVHSLHTMAESFAVHSRLVTAQRVVIIGAGYRDGSRRHPPRWSRAHGQRRKRHRASRGPRRDRRGVTPNAASKGGVAGIHLTGDHATGRLLGAQILGHRTGQIGKPIDIYAAALHAGLTVDALNDLDLSYTPPYGSPWDAVQTAAQAWRACRRRTTVSG